MKIKEININGLFGMFNHKILLNTKEHLTIIYGINGIGKTMLFKILDNFFNLKFSQLINAPFDELRVVFSDNSYFKLQSAKSKFTVKFIDEKNNVSEVFDLSKYKPQKKDSRVFRELERILPMSRYSEDKYIFHDNDEILSTEEVLRSYTKYIPNEIFDKIINIENIVELRQRISKSKIHFIETQRLLKFNESNAENLRMPPGRAMIRSSQNFKIETVKNYSEELAQLIREKHSEYSKLSEKLELSLGKRLMNKEVETISDIEKLKEENIKLEEKRNKLKAVGLFEDVKNDNFTIPDNIDDLSKAVLSVNIQDMKAKLDIFDELHTKLNVFLDVLNNKRFSYKKISVHPKKGFVFTNANEQPLEVTQLSSGEQHEIVIFYELLFKVPESSLVLFDEPEISLHVAWQKDFLKDMSEIIKIRNFDILIATHSPSIIDGNWDLTVELQKIQ